MVGKDVSHSVMLMTTHREATVQKLSPCKGAGFAPRTVFLSTPTHQAEDQEHKISSGGSTPLQLHSAPFGCFPPGTNSVVFIPQAAFFLALRHGHLVPHCLEGFSISCPQNPNDVRRNFKILPALRSLVLQKVLLQDRLSLPDVSRMEGSV